MSARRGGGESARPLADMSAEKSLRTDPYKCSYKAFCLMKSGGGQLVGTDVGDQNKIQRINSSAKELSNGEILF